MGCEAVTIFMMKRDRENGALFSYQNTAFARRTTNRVLPIPGLAGEKGQAEKGSHYVRLAETDFG